MEENVFTYKIATHESVVHAQLSALHRLLGRDVQYRLVLNRHQSSSTIQFQAPQSEEEVLREHFGLAITRKDGLTWMPLEEAR